ncbi:MAG: transposase [Verrucomicrobia bacterium]|jgi:REP element-mobilizing transposase RayT|nr:transposase [Verrucomicrobiota bacterium]
MRRRLKSSESTAIHHAMSRIVGGAMLLEQREKEVLRKMLWQVADFCGVEVLTYAIMSNHFHVLVRVPENDRAVSDAELLRRFKVLYPKPTKYQTASFRRLENALKEGTEDAVKIRSQLLARMHDLSEFMKTLKQRFSIWYNRNHDGRLGTLWMERFKSVLVQGGGNPLQTMAAYIDLNPVRAGLVEDPKDYRWCGYAEAVAGAKKAQRGLELIWANYTGGGMRDTGGEIRDTGCEMRDTRGEMRDGMGVSANVKSAMAAHRSLIFGKGASPWTCRGKLIDREIAERVLNEERGELPLAVVLRCRVRYFTDGAILGSLEFVRSFAAAWQAERGRSHPVTVNRARGAPWGDFAVINSMRRALFR